MDRRGVITLVGALLFAGVGFTLGSFGGAWTTYEDYASPWRKMRVEHEGLEGSPGHTRVIIQNPKMPVQAIDLSTSADGVPTIARVSLKNGQELEMTFDEKGRAASLTGPDGIVARFGFESDRMRVAFFAADGSAAGIRKITIPRALVTAQTETTGRSTLARAIDLVGDALVSTAYAQQADDSPITVVREVVVGLDVRASGDLATAGKAQIDATCTMPGATIGCAPRARDITTPGSSEVVVTVTGTVDRKGIPAPQASDIEAFREHARDERKQASRALPQAAKVMSALGMTAIACRGASVTAALCVKEFKSDAAVAGGAISSLMSYDASADTSVIETRARKLFDEDRARAALDKTTHVEICVTRERAARVCTTVDGRAFAESPLQKATRAVELKTDLAPSLAGSFVMTQSDGSDCKFSPSPKTSGSMKLSFDDEKGAVSAILSSAEQGTRQNLACSLGTANMGWNQTYSINANQSFTKEQLHSGGKLPLRLQGTMSGTGGYGFSNCRSSGGASASCPGGKNEGYNYPVEIVGEIDLGTRVGSGTIIVKGAPLTTSGTWRVPAEGK